MNLPIVNDSSRVLPPLYAAWMDELLKAPIPQESHATCDDCAMCRPGESPSAESGFFFDPGIKCCTFIPQLPNFLVGRVLLDLDPAAAIGRATLEARLASNVAVTPVGVGRHPDDEMRYDRISQAGGFGRTRAIRCPHYIEQSGQCGIWRHRDSTCSTWFCKHVRGATGHAFWRTLQQLLATVETQLATWCVLELDPGVESLRRLFPLQGTAGTDPLHTGVMDGVPAPEIRRALWGRWAGREHAFFKACAERVASLTWATLLDLCSPEVRALAGLTREAFDRLTSTQPPARLRCGPYNVLRATHDNVVVFAYSPTDPLEIPKPVIDALHYFDGRATGEVLDDITAKTGIRIDEGLVRKLADFKILISAEPGTAAPA